MSKDDLITQLHRLVSDGKDTGEDHKAADALLLAYIGDADITAAFEALFKYYE